MEVNDYVRTKNYGIAKITQIDHIELVAYTDNKNVVFGVDEQKCVEITGVNTPPELVGTYYKAQDNEYILDYNSNIIDLIEVGDIIKYHPVQNNYVKTNILYKTIKNERELIELEYDITHNKKSIISIVTKEQFERCEYKI